MRTYVTYHKQGFVAQEGDSADFASGGFWRRVEDMSPRGEVERETLGNGLENQFDDYPATGQMASTVIDDNSVLYDQFYEYDLFGNLTQQFLTATNRAETYCYDDLHRLVGADRFPTWDATQICDGSYQTSYTYDAVGNITSKSDYASTYTYGGSRPNAVSQVNLVGGGTSNFTYDGNGNLTTGSADGLSVTYDPFNKPIVASRNGATANFQYGPNGNRFRQTGNKSVVYIDKLYERIGGAEHKLYLGGYAVYNVGGSDPGLFYLHKDRLGSIVALSTESGNLEITATRHFDPFGKPREGDLSDSADPNNDLNREDLTSRGFTSHEHLNSVQLIHMNGRAYDYNLGRFLSVDPIIQFLGNSQSLNPYSYILNNPMAGTDPSGYRASICPSLSFCSGWDRTVAAYQTAKLLLEKKDSSNGAQRQASKPEPGETPADIGSTSTSMKSSTSESEGILPFPDADGQTWTAEQEKVLEGEIQRESTAAQNVRNRLRRNRLTKREEMALLRAFGEIYGVKQKVAGQLNTIVTRLQQLRPSDLRKLTEAAVKSLSLDKAFYAGEIEGEIWLSQTYYNDVVAGSAAFVLLHEVGHVIGMAHPAKFYSNVDRLKAARRAVLTRNSEAKKQLLNNPYNYEVLLEEWESFEP